MKQEWHEIGNPNVILRAEVGSRLYGTALPPACTCDPLVIKQLEVHADKCKSRELGGDRDELGVCIEPLEVGIGFSDFEQYIYRSAAEREQEHDAKSQSGDLDLTIYGLKKFLRLCLKGNPTVIQLLFVEKAIRRDANGARLQELAPLLVSKAAGGAFLGYLQAQRMRFTGERGGSHGAVHSEDREKYGYDTKYAMHMLRLGYQGVEILSTGKLTFPVPERDFLLNVRQGKSSTQEILSRTGELEREIKDLIKNSDILPEEPDRDGVEEWMIRTYWYTWKAQAGHPNHKLYDKGWEFKGEK